MLLSVFTEYIEGHPMEILGIGPLELLLIILIALIILGPKDLIKTGKSLGHGLNKLVKSDAWKTARQASEKVRSLPNELMREAGLEDMKKSLDSEVIQPVKNTRTSLDSWASESWVAESTDPKKDSAELASGDPNKIAPPTPKEEQSK
jgi:Sec-independent protein translocase protein TatA